MSSETFDVQTISTPQPLNPILISALHLAFPQQAAAMRIVNMGEHRQTERCGIVNQGFIEAFGEEYELACPFCGDARTHMRINHSYDPAINMGRWHCYRRGCQNNRECRAQLSHRLQAVWCQARQTARNPQSSTTPRLITSRTNPGTPIDPRLPDGTIPIKDLPDEHPAVQYLKSRNFDIGRLWDEFQIGYTDGSRFPAPTIGTRIVIPVVEPALKPGDRPNLLGWQARLIPGLPPDLHPGEKYMNMFGFNKSKILYAAVHGPLADELFVVEGAPDAWRLGRSAVALFGKVANPTQLARLVEIGQFSSRIFVALDRDAEFQKQELVRDLQQRLAILGVGTQVFSLPIPEPHKDVGECSDAELMNAKALAIATASTARITTPRVQCSSADIADQARPVRIVPPNELAERLIENATGTPPVPSEDHSDQLQSLGMLRLYQELEIPLQPVLRSIEQQGLLVRDNRLRRLVCNHSPLAAEAARLRRAICRRTNRVHTQLDSLGSRTGQITSSACPLQNMNRQLRPCVVADEQCKLVYADYGQFQWRIAAGLSGDPLLLWLFSQPEFDLYQTVTTAVSAQERTCLHRSIVKECMMEFLFSRTRLNQRTDEGRAVSRFLAHNHPHLLEWLQSREQLSSREGFVRTPFGRMVHLIEDDDGSQAIRTAVNYLVQATAADVFKHACLAVHRAVSASARILLPLHDALLLDCCEADVDQVAATIVQAMQMPITGLPVRLEVKTTISDHWG